MTTFIWQIVSLDKDHELDSDPVFDKVKGIHWELQGTDNGRFVTACGVVHPELEQMDLSKTTEETFIDIVKSTLGETSIKEFEDSIQAQLDHLEEIGAEQSDKPIVWADKNASLPWTSIKPPTE